MVTFVETPLFTRALPEYLDDEEYAELQRHLDAHPEAGDVVPGSGGVRKLRWAAKGKGARGGVRVIYFLKVSVEQIWLLTLYGKGVRENIPAHLLRKIREAIEHG